MSVDPFLDPLHARPRAVGRPRRVRAVAIGVLWLLACCKASTCAPEVTVAGRGRLLAQGHFSGLQLGGVLGEQGVSAFILALEDADAAGGRLTVIPFDGAPSCELARAQSYGFPGRWASGMNVTGREPRIPFFGTLDAAFSGELGFGDLGCSWHSPALSRAVYPARNVWDPISLDVSGFLAGSPSGEVFLLDPWNQTSSLLASGLEGWQFDGKRLWLVEGGQLVVRDLLGAELFRTGSGVREVALSYLGEAAFIDAAGLSIVAPGLDQAPVFIEADACQPGYLLAQPPALTYLSPCHTRRLNLLQPDTGLRQAFAEAAGQARLIDGWLFYVTGPEGTHWTGDLWAVPPGGSPVLVGVGGNLQQISALGLDQFLLLLDYAHGGGRLGRWSQQEGFSEIHPRVAKFACRYDRIVLVGDLQGATGTLSVLRFSDLRVELTAQSVLPGGFAFSYEYPALGFIDEFDSALGVGRLHVFILPTADLIEVDVEVSEFVEILRPEAGVIYAINRGEAAGIWFGPVEMR